MKTLVKRWFDKWTQGDFLNLTISDDFRHTSPYGLIDGKENYINLVDANKKKFLGHKFEILDELYEKDRACVRYTAIKDDFTLEVSEWHYFGNGQIKEIFAYYNIEGEISEGRKLSS